MDVFFFLPLKVKVRLPIQLACSLAVNLGNGSCPPFWKNATRYAPERGNRQRMVILHHEVNSLGQSKLGQVSRHSTTSRIIVK